MNIIRIDLNLTYFLDDHRRLTRMVIKDDIKTIKDLKKYITRTFDIKKFYLICDNHYLPPVSDIRVLSDKDVVVVVPSKKVSKNKKSYEELSSEKEAATVIELPEPTNIVEGIKQCPPRKIGIKILEVREIKPCNRYSSPMLEQNNSTIESNTNPSNEKQSKKSKKSKKCSDLNNSTNTTSIPMQTAETNYETNATLPAITCEQAIEPTVEMKQKITWDQVEKGAEADKSVMINWIDPESVQVGNDSNVNTSVLNQTEMNDTIKSRSKGSKRSESLKCSGVGDVINLLNKTSDDLADSSNTEDTAIEFVTKRRRPRVRPRKRKRMENGVVEIDTSQSESTIFQPPKSRAKPLSHIIFEDNEADGNTEQNNQARTKHFAHSTPYHKQVNNSLSNLDIESPITPSNNENKSGNEEPAKKQIDLSKASLIPLSKQQPSIGSVLLFKRLKLGADYTPQISNYILAEVQEISKVGNQLTLKLLDGHGEFEEPRGKFSCVPEDNEEEEEETIPLPVVESIQLDKNALIDAKLVIS